MWIPQSDTPEATKATIEAGGYSYLLSLHFRPKYALLAGLANTFGLAGSVLDAGSGFPLLSSAGLKYDRYVAVDHCPLFFEPFEADGRQEFVVADFITWSSSEQFDVVVSAGLSTQYSHTDVKAWLEKCEDHAKHGAILIFESSTFPVRGLGSRTLEYVTDGVLHLEMVPFYGPHRWWAVFRKAR